MECQMIGISRGCPENQAPWFSWKSTNLDWKAVHSLRCNVTGWNVRVGSQKCTLTCQAFIGKKSMHRKLWRTFSMPINLDEDFLSPFSQYYSNDDEISYDDSPEELLDPPPGSDELKLLSADSERAKLIKKLSEANQHNRFLKRQLYVKEDTLVGFKSKLAVMELEVQALVSLAEEIAKSAISEGSRKINGKYIQSHLHSRLKAVLEKLKEEIGDVDAAQSKVVFIFWCGMAESVQVMGTFDGWSQGEHLSPEYTGSFTRFSTSLMLRPGRYEIKFLVDGQWQLSPEFPTVGEGLMDNFGAKRCKMEQKGVET